MLETVQPRFWLALGSTLACSALRVADIVKSQNAVTEIVCIDDFSGNVDMWLWEEARTKAREPGILLLERGRPTIYERFLANVASAGHSDIILPISTRPIIGIELLQRLIQQGRLFFSPMVIYFDRTYDAGETFIELRKSWELLKPGGVLLGDNWGLTSVRDDVLRFVRTVSVNQEGYEQLTKRYAQFIRSKDILLAEGQWALVK